MTELIIAQGNKLGYQQVGSTGAAVSGAVGTKGVDNMGVALDGAKIGARLRISRKVMPATEACPGMDSAPSDDTLRAMANAQVKALVGGMNAAEFAACTHLEPWNEPVSHTDAGFTALAKLMMFTCDAAEAHGKSAILFSLACGGYEWSQIIAAIKTQVGGESLLPRLIRGGHRLGGHEGILGGYPDRLDATIFGCSLPGGPYLRQAHPLVMRWLFWREAARQLNQPMPPFDITEFYPVLNSVASYDPNVPAGRIEYYESLLAQYAEGGVVFPYAVGVVGAALPAYNMAALWPRLSSYTVTIQSRTNAGPAVPPPPPPPQPANRLVGLHMRADGPNAPADIQAAAMGKVRAVKFMTGARPEDVVAVRALDPDMLIVVRIFQDMGGRLVKPIDFCLWNAPDIARFYNQGVRLFEVHNEPNLYSEGLSTSWSGGAGFGNWFAEVCRQLRGIFPGIQLGWPGLSPGPSVPGVRQDSAQFARDAGAAPLGADWISQHVYWTDPWELAQVDGQLDARQALYPGKPIYITEFANPSPSASAKEKGTEYVTFYQMLATRAAPPVAAFAFCASASASVFASEVWRMENGAMTDIPAIVGARQIVTPPPANQLKVINCTVLNVREFPWTGAVTPQVVRQLKAGDLVTVQAVYRSPAMANGWACLSPDSNQWVNSFYLGPA